MIVPNVRNSFGRSEAAFLIWLVSRGAEDKRAELEERVNNAGFDALLDDPVVFNAIMAGREFSSASTELVFYLMVRHALLEDGISDRLLADYLAALLVAFGKARRAYRLEEDQQEFFHLVDIVAAGSESTGTRAFMLRAHLGEFALWLSGLFPDHITSRVQRRGAPGLGYYEELGSFGYRLAARTADAEEHGLDRVYSQCAETFPALRVALNRIADRHMFPATGDRIERLLRQISDQFGRMPDTPH